ncbi:MDR family MFS transporter [Streptomyces sp. NBC_01190]|uniref:MDR family MFS transporter n=1 Tax=Streptomyces sp. NBC_01190 TaxID=2903767 RepID=UPI00386334BD|nr:multidrug efflux MFS transporter [Streptomyces sp. NBC_01190]
MKHTVPPSAVPPDEEDRLDPQLVRIGLVLVLAAVLASLDGTIVNVGVGPMASGLSTTLSVIQWVSTGYLLTVALVAPLAGWLIERFGGKRMWLASVAVFVAASALSGMAWSPSALIAFRMLQGVGGGLMEPIGQAIVAKIAGPRRIGRLIGVITMPVALAPILGPVLGGILVHGAGWRWLFYLNVPVGIAALVLAVRIVPDDRGERQTTLKPDVLGLVLLPPGLAAVVYALSHAGGHGLDLRHALLLAAGFALLAGYVVHALRIRTAPLLDLRLFAGRGFTLASINTFLLGATLYSSMLLIPLYFLQVRGLSTLQAALMLAPQAIGTAVVTPLAGRFTDTYGPRAVVVVGIVLTLLGTVPFVLPTAHGGFAVLVAALFVRGVGFGAITPPNVAATYTSVRRSQVSAATSARTVLNRIGGSIGTAVLAVILQSALADGGGSVGDAYVHTFWWSLAFGALTLVPAAMYPRRAPGQD